MRIVRSLDRYAADAELLLSIGVFDGVHVGHRAVLSRLLAQRQPGQIAGALTFDRHPQEFLDPQAARRVYLTTTDEKVNLLAGCGLDVLFLLPFDERIQSLEPEEFVESMLVQRLRTSTLIVGDQWRFGKGRRGDAALAQTMLTARGCVFEAAPLLERDGEKVSSSRIRALIAERRFAEADALLGSPYALRGMVVMGDGRGHELGYPTANMVVPAQKLVPGAGVYACRAHYEGRSYDAVTSLGDKPTFGGQGFTIETYIPGFNASIYGHQLSLSEWHFLRAQERFPDASALVLQMRRDVESMRSHFRGALSNQANAYHRPTGAERSVERS